MKAKIIQNGVVKDRLPVYSQGEFGQTISFIILDSNNSRFDLTGYSVKLRYKLLNIFNEFLLDETITIDNASEGECSYQFKANDLFKHGTFSASLEIASVSNSEIIELGFQDIKKTDGYVSSGTILDNSGSTDDLPEGSANKYFSVERVQDVMGNTLNDNNYITWNYDDVNNTLKATTNLTQFSTTDLSEGTNLYYTDERVDDRVNNLLIAGTNLVKTYDDVNGTLTLDATGNTTEEIQDIVGGMVTTNTETLITVTYQDVDGTLDFVVNNDLSLYDNSVSGFITDYTVTQADVTQYESALTITESQISDLGSYLENVVEDTTPQAGGNFDLQTNKLVGEGGTDGLYVDSTGNVGIGTTTPNNKLQVAGLIDFNDTTKTTLLGNEAGANMDTTGSLYNTAVGYQALRYNTTGNSNIANGYRTLYNNTTGTQNTANGNAALRHNTTGGNNTANGVAALYNNTTGDNNTANGFASLLNLDSGNYNTALGNYTGHGITTGSANTILGANVTDLPAALSNNIIIADGDGNQRIRVDSSGNVGIGTATPDTKLHVAGAVTQEPISADPADPDAGNSVQWVSTGTSTGSAGETLIKTNVASTVETITVPFATDTLVGRATTDTLTNKSGNISQWTNDSGYLTNINGELISDLSNVTFTTLSSNDILRYNGTNFVNVDLDAEVSNNTDVSKSKFLQSDKNAGTPNGGVTISEDGAMEFDLGYLDVGNPPQLQITGGEITMYAWINLPQRTGHKTGFINKYQTSGNQRSYTLDKFDDAVRMILSSDGSSVTNIYTTSYPIGEDFLLMGILKNGVAELYVNNQLVSSNTFAPTSLFNTSADFYINRNFENRADANINYITGVFDIGLNEEQRTEIYNAGPNAYSPIGDGLKAQYTGKNFEGTEANPTKIYNMLSSDEVINQDVTTTGSPTFKGLITNSNIRLDGYGTTDGAIESIGTLNLVAGYDNSGNEEIKFFPANTESGKFSAAGDLILFNKLDVTGDSILGGVDMSNGSRNAWITYDDADGTFVTQVSPISNMLAMKGYNGFSFHTNTNNNIVVMEEGGNVGIGTASPSDKLEVSDPSPSISVRDSDTTGSSARGFLEFNDNTNSANGRIGMFSTTGDVEVNNLNANDILFKTQNSTRMVVDSLGNVGIGTTSPLGELNVHRETDNSRQFITTNATGKVADTVYWNKIDGFKFGVGVRLNDGKFGINHGDYAGRHDDFIIDMSGNVGIGTASPSAPFEVLGNGKYINISVGDGGTNAFASRETAITLTKSNVPNSYTNIISTSVSTNPEDNGIYFEPCDGTSTGHTTAMVINGAGNVGIGTTSPQAKFHIAGGSGNDILVDNSGRFESKTAAGDIKNMMGTNTNNDIFIGDTSGWTDIKFFPGNSEAMRITNPGNVGIGTTTPGATLDVEGDIQYTSARSSVPAFSNLGSTYTVDFATGTHFSGILNSDVTLTFSNAVSGDKITLILEYDGTAQRTITYPAGIMWAGGSTPTAPASAGKLVVTIMYDGVNYLASGQVFE